MDWKDYSSGEALRLRLAAAGMALLLSVLVGGLWRVQVVHGARYERQFDKQSMRRVRLPGGRGRILDRHGLCLAGNRPSYCMAFYIEELRQPGKWTNTIAEVQRQIARLGGVLGATSTVSAAEIAAHIRRRLPMPLLAWRDLSETQVARWAEHALAFPAVDISIEPVRVYAHGRLAAHVLGHVGRAEFRQDPATPYDFYLPEVEGRRGIEQSFNDVLSGEPGARLIRVDASGYRHAYVTHNDQGGFEPTRGRDVMLTLDTRIQQLAEEALGDTPGAAIVLDPRNGDVLAMASVPAFDLNDFVPHLPEALWDALCADERRPLVNRAVGGVYAPGSLFKPVVAVAALENGRTTPERVYSCPGYYALGRMRIRCWNRGGHGPLDLERALEQSCNTYFCSLGADCGYDAIYHTAAALGLGETTGIELPAEVAGLLPSKAWKRAHLHDAWRIGDTCNASIGQGFLGVTPLQMAVVAAALANGGTVYRPRLVRGVSRVPGGEMVMRSPGRVRDLNWSESTRRVVREGMRAVIHAPHGTGRLALVEGVEMAGKTGTAEYGRKEEDRRHGWMMAFAPFADPRYAAVIVCDDAESGGRTAAPRMRELMDGIFNGRPDPRRVGRDPEPAG